MQIHGIIKVIFDTQEVSDKFKKREFVVTTESNTPYPQHVSFQVTQDKCDILDKYEEGQEVSVDFNLRGREWNGPQGVKYFNTLDAWRLQLVNNEKPTQQDATQNVVENNVENNSSDNDDLPF